MSEVKKLLEKSLGQTTECQDMANQLMEWCHMLVDKVKSLELENEHLRQQLKEKTVDKRKLIRFQQEFCPNVPLNSPEMTSRLLQEIARLREEIDENE